MSRRRDPRAALRLPAPIAGDIAGAAPARIAPVRRIADAWTATVGEALARVAQPARMTRDRTLVVHAADASWVHAITLERRTILQRLEAALGDAAPADLRVEVGPITVAPTVAEPMETPVTEAAETRADELTRGVADPALREALSRAVAKTLSRPKSL